MNKKKVLIHSTFSRGKTGFARNAREVLSYLFSTKKYDVVEYGAGVRFSDEGCKKVPWKCYGSLPDDDNEIKHIQDQSQMRMVHYGSWNIDKVIDLEKPDVYIGIEDIWAFQGYWEKPWWNKIKSAIWTTLDSLPILPLGVENANKIENYWVWSQFAEDEMIRLGFPHVKTVHGIINQKDFFPARTEEKKELRAAFGLKDELIFGFVFRNQLRKLVGSLIEGFAEFKKRNSGSKAKLLLHTHWGESWPIEYILKVHEVDKADVLTTYFCAKCGSLDVTPFRGQGVDCRFCGTKGGSHNPLPSFGGTEEQMNMIYNLMDAYIHPMTSGGLEMPIVEAMLAGLPVATTNYSCGEEFCKNKFVYNINYSTYREVNSYFVKASAQASSIAAFMTKVSKNKGDYQLKGYQGMNWAREFYAPQKTFKFLEDFIDNAPKANWDQISVFKKSGNPQYPLQPIKDDRDWLIDMYKNILNMDESPDSEGVKHWLSKLEMGVPRETIYKFFVETCSKENSKHDKFDFETMFLQNGKKRIVYVMPKSLGDCIISLSVLKALKEEYKDWDLYICTEQSNNEIFAPFVGDLLAGILPYQFPMMDNFGFWEGTNNHKGFCDIAFMPHFTTQRYPNYSHNGVDTNPLQRKTIQPFDPSTVEPDWTLDTR